MTIAFVESSALMKLVVAEAESTTLRRAISDSDHVVASQLAYLEVLRSAARVDGDDGRARARAALLRFSLIPVDRPIVDSAAQLGPDALRSLDAIHVATALALESPDVVFFAYDQRTIHAARANGLTVASPGA